MLNQAILIGRLVADPELRYTPGEGTAVAEFTLAVDRPFVSKETGGREADFIKVITWRKQAEACAQYLKKGSQAAVVGRLQIRSFDDREGIRRKVTEVVASEVKFLQRPGSGGQETENSETLDNEQS